MKGYSIYKIFSFLLIFPLLICSCNVLDGDENVDAANSKNIIETGELAAVNSRSFTLPRYGRNWYEMRIIGLLEHGTIVNPGDSIIQIDPTEIKKFIVERETNLEAQEAALEKLKIDQDNKINELESSIKSEVASFNLKKIELESSRFESERYKKIKQLEFKQAEIRLAKEKRRLELSRIINKNDLEIQKVKVRQIENDVKNAYNLLPTLTIRTPIAGVFQVARNRRGIMTKVGDNVYPGNNMANVPELKLMKVNTYINENDFLKINVGQKVAVRLDAMPKVVFDGKITYIGKLCRKKEEKSREKVFDVEVAILKSDERLKPGMTVSCEFLENN